MKRRRLTADEHDDLARRLRARIYEMFELGRELDRRTLTKTQDAHTRVTKAMQVLQSRLDAEWYSLPLAEREGRRTPYYGPWDEEE